jgi:hypothetical protein
MARPLRIAFPGAFYHVTARGNERKAVFKRKRDREKFLAYLESATESYQAVIHAYCLIATPVQKSSDFPVPQTYHRQPCRDRRSIRHR